jgi:predicted amidohydrolase
MIIKNFYRFFAVVCTVFLAVPLSSGQTDCRPDTLRVAVVQMDVVDGDLAANMKTAEMNIRKAAGMKADIVCLPEVVDFGWLYQQARRDAFPIPGKYSDFICDLARKLNIWISVGCLEKDGDKTYNSAILVDRSGNIVLKHRKINTLPDLTSHLYDAGSADDIRVVDTEFGVIGITICADNFTIENSKRVAELGAWLLITPHGYAARVKDVPDNAVRYMTHIRNIAKQTGLWVVGPNTCLSEVAGGEWKGWLHSGCSTIANPEGKVVVFGKFREPDLIVYDIVREK